MAVTKLVTFHMSPSSELDEMSLQLNSTEDALRITEQYLEDELKRWRLLIEQSRDGIVVLDSNGKVYEANKQFAIMLGYTRDEIQQLHVWEWDTLFSEQEIRQMLKFVDASGDHFETRHRRKDGSIIDVEISTNGTLYRGEKLIFCICRDITEKKALLQALEESEARYRELSRIDELTQLFNARYFHDQLALEIERANRTGQPLSLMLFDIDNFKAYNDQLGHVAGDHLLSKIGEVLKHCLRHTDSAYRYGGEEFTVLLPDTELDGGVTLAEKVRATCKQRCLTPESEQLPNPTISIGVAQYQPKETAKQLVQRADENMYQIKHCGKDGVLGK